jgi:hypothetical protein
MQPQLVDDICQRQTIAVDNCFYGMLGKVSCIIDDNARCPLSPSLFTIFERQNPGVSKFGNDQLFRRSYKTNKDCEQPLTKVTKHGHDMQSSSCYISDRLGLVELVHDIAPQKPRRRSSLDNNQTSKLRSITR